MANLSKHRSSHVLWIVYNWSKHLACYIVVQFICKCIYLCVKGFGFSSTIHVALESLLYFLFVSSVYRYIKSFLNSQYRAYVCVCVCVCLQCACACVCVHACDVWNLNHLQNMWVIMLILGKIRSKFKVIFFIIFGREYMPKCHHCYNCNSKEDKVVRV